MFVICTLFLVPSIFTPLSLYFVKTSIVSFFPFNFICNRGLKNINIISDDIARVRNTRTKILKLARSVDNIQIK